METAYIIRNGVIIGSGTNSSLNPDSSSTYIINCTIVSETGLETEVTNYDGDFTKIKQTIADGGKVELRTNFNSSNYILEPSRIEENYVTFNTIDKNANITIKVTKYGINDVSYIDLNSNGGATIDDAVTSTDTTWSSKKTSDEIAEKVDKTDITTTIDSTSTDTQVPSAKSVNDKYEEANVYKGKYVGDLNDIPFIKSGVVYKYDIRSGNCTNTPVGTHGILYSTYFDSDNYCLQEFHSLQTNKASIYRRDKGTGVWSDWQELATMDKVKDGYAKIIKNNDTDTNDAMFIAYKNRDLFGIRIYKDDDSEHELKFSTSGVSYVKNGVTVWTTRGADVGVGVTTITPVNSNITGNIEYTVKNGICYVSMKDLMSTISSTNLLISTAMPKPSINCTASSVDASGNIAMIYIDKNTTNLRGNFYTKNAKSNCSFSYPVAE